MDQPKNFWFGWGGKLIAAVYYLWFIVLGFVLWFPLKMSFRKGDGSPSKQKRLDVRKTLRKMTSASSVQTNKTSIETLAVALIRLLDSGGIDEQVTALDTLIKSIPPSTLDDVDHFVETGIVAKLVDLLKDDVDRKLKSGSLRVLINITCGTFHHSASVVRANGIKTLIKLIGTDDKEIAWLSTWCLGNICGEQQPFWRAMSIKNGIIPMFVKWINFTLARNREEQEKEAKSLPYIPTENERFIEHLLSTMRNIYRNPHPSNETAQLLLLAPCLAVVLKEFKNTVVLLNACWIIGNLCTLGGGLVNIAVIKTGVIPDLVKQLTSIDRRLQFYALRAIIAIASRVKGQIKVFLNSDILSKINEVLKNPNDETGIRAIMVIGIFATCPEHIQKIIDANLVDQVLKAKVYGGEILVEALRTLTIILCTATDAQAVSIDEKLGLVKCLCELLKRDWDDETTDKVTEEKVLSMTMIALDGLLENDRKMPEGVKKWELQLEKFGGIDLVEKLQEHESEVVYSQAYSWIVKHFSYSNRS